MDSFRVLMSCGDQIEQLPPGATVLAGNEHCPVGMLRCGSLLGIQGHPEFTTEYSRALLEFRRERIGTQAVDAALATLNDSTDAPQLSRWIVNFLSDDSQFNKR
jgi:GMP synthase-like glutamine amidotransferase